MNELKRHFLDLVHNDPDLTKKEKIALLAIVDQETNGFRAENEGFYF